MLQVSVLLVSAFLDCRFWVGYTAYLDVSIDLSRMALDPGLELRLACGTDICIVCFAPGAAKYIREQAHCFHDLFVALAESGLARRGLFVLLE